MKISKKSWHYRYLKVFDVPTPDNLCAYFWCVVFFTVFFTVVPTVLGMAGIGLFLVLATMFWFEFLMTVLVAVAIVGMLYSGHRFDLWMISKSGKQPTILVGQYLKAKKDKVCPRIDFED